ncbi:MAG: RICIN domain-containing protein [Phaeodactylibacter sp.]|nr:RICIN domain-containing protein [Phaeodactylibacter sp.]
MKKFIFFLILFLATSSFLEAQCPRECEGACPPLHIGFLDAPDILNDNNSENTLSIGVFNMSMPSTSGRDNGNYTIQAGSKLFFRFITDDQPANANTYTRPWGLTSNDLIHASTVKISGSPGKWAPSNEENVPYRPDMKGFILTAEKDVVLKPGEHVSVTISGLKSGLPSGPASAFFRFQSGSRSECPLMITYGPIQKSPIHTDKQKAGIGTNQTNAADFNVKGGMRVEGGALQPGKDNNTGYSFNNGDGSTGIASRKDGQVGVYANGFETASFEDEKGSPALALNGELWVKERFFPPTPGQIYYIQAGNGMVWDVYNFSKDPGARINLANNAYGDNKQQQWKLIPDNSGYYRLWNVNSGLVADYSNQALSQQKQSNAASQLFRLNAVGDGSFYLESKQEPGKVLTISDGSYYGGTIPMVLEMNRRQQNQQLRFVEPGQKGASLAKLGSGGKYQISEKPNVLTINAESGTSIAFTNGDSKNFSIESNTGNTATKGTASIGGNANIGGSADIAGNTQVRHNLTISGATQSDGNLNVNGKVTLKGNAPIIYQTFYTGRLTDNYFDRYKTLDTGISKNDYVGTIAGYKIEYYDARDDDKGRFAMRIIDDGGSTLKLEVRIYADQPVDQVVVNALFFRKELVEFR